jgi:Tfp pilus assembly protein PilO
MIRLATVRRMLGALGFAAVALAGATAAFQALVLAPMQAREAALRDRVARLAPGTPAQAAQSPADKVAAVYQFLARKEETTDWLAKLHAIGESSGVRLSSAAYRHQGTGTPIQRYEIVLPLAGGYPQIREFLRRAAAEIPLMSVDQLTLKRESRGDGELQAELRLTLHMVKS